MMYDGIINKPSLDEALEHYGVKGMKWKKRKKQKYLAKKAVQDVNQQILDLLLSPIGLTKDKISQYKRVSQLNKLIKSKKGPDNKWGPSNVKYDKKNKRYVNKDYKGTGTVSSKARQLVGKVKNRNKNSYIPSFNSAMAGDSRYNRPSDGMYNDPRYKKKKRF